MTIRPEHDHQPELSEAVERVLRVEPALNRPPSVDLAQNVQRLLNISQEQAGRLISESERLYIQRMTTRFSSLRVSERLKRTNPFLLQIRGARSVQDWASLQVQSALYSSEEEAVGHLLEAIAKICFPGATTPLYPDDFDFEVILASGEVHGYQIKMSWDCMPMSSRKNLSNTIRKVRETYEAEGQSFLGIFAPCYGKATTTRPTGQEYVSMASREFWYRVGGGTVDFDVQVGEVCALLCAEFRATVLRDLVPDLVTRLVIAATPLIGDQNGELDYRKLFRRVNA